MAASASTSASASRSCSPLLDFPRLLTSLSTHIASRGLEGVSIASIFQHLERCEHHRRREERLAERAAELRLTEEEDDDDDAAAPSAELDPFVRFHIIRLLQTPNNGINFFCKQPQVLTPELEEIIRQGHHRNESKDTLTPAASSSSSSNALSFHTSSIHSDSQLQLLYIRTLCEAARRTASSHIGGGTAAFTTSFLPSDQSLLDESLNTGTTGWFPTGQGLIHSSSFTRFQLLHSTLQSLTPDEFHHLASSLILVGTWKLRCKFLGLTEEDITSIKPFNAPASKTTSNSSPIVGRENYGAPFLLYNMLETIGKFSVQTLVPPGSSSKMTNHGGLLQTHLSRILKMTSSNTFRFLMILEARCMVTPIRVVDDLRETPLGAGWRWFLAHYAPSLHTAARHQQSMTAGKDRAFTSNGILTAELPLTAFQASLIGLQTYYQQTNWKTLRRKIRTEKTRLSNLKVGSLEDDSLVKFEDGGEEGAAATAAAASGELDAKSSSAIFPTMDVRFSGDVARHLQPPNGFLANSSLTQQIYRFIVERGTLGTSSVDIRRHFQGYYSMKTLHAQLQILLKSFDVTSVADQTGRSMVFKFFSKRDFELFKQQHETGLGPAAAPIAESKPQPTNRKSTTSSVTVSSSATKPSPTMKQERETAASTTPASTTAASSTSKLKQSTIDFGRPSTKPSHNNNATSITSSKSTPSDIVAAANIASSTDETTAAAVAAAANLHLAFDTPSISPPTDQAPSSPSRPSPIASLLPPSPSSSSQPPSSVDTNKKRLTIKTMQREKYCLQALHESDCGMLRAIDVSKYISFKELGQPITQDNVLTHKTMIRMFNKLSSQDPPQLKQISIAVTTVNGNPRNVLILALPSVDFTLQETKTKAVELANQTLLNDDVRARMANSAKRTYEIKQKRKRPSTSTRKSRTGDDDADEEEDEDEEEGEDEEDEIENDENVIDGTNPLLQSRSSPLDATSMDDANEVYAAAIVAESMGMTLPSMSSAVDESGKKSGLKREKKSLAEHEEKKIDSGDESDMSEDDSIVDG